jgi:hypothetical protein
MLHFYKRPVAPNRPYILDMSDEVLLEKILDARASSRPNKETRTLVSIFGRWRGDVLLCEMKARSNIELLLRAASHCHLDGDEDTAYRLLVFAGNEYGFHVDVVPTEDSEIKSIAEKYSRYSDIMPDMLIDEKRTIQSESQGETLFEIMELFDDME